VSLAKHRTLPVSVRAEELVGLTAPTISTSERYPARRSGMVVCRVAMRRAGFS
jgi:hypothetical protein